MYSYIPLGLNQLLKCRSWPVVSYQYSGHLWAVILLMVSAWAYWAHILSGPARACPVPKAPALVATSREGDVWFHLKPFEAQEDVLGQGWGIEHQEKGPCLYLDSDTESNRSAKLTRCRAKIKTGLVSDDGYQRFDPLVSKEEDSWHLLADPANYLKRQAPKGLNKEHKKALKQEARNPKEQALQPPKIDNDFVDLFNKPIARKQNKPAGGALSSLHDTYLQHFQLNFPHWMPQDLIKHQSTVIQLMAWCRQTTGHQLCQCWPRSKMPYGFTAPQSVNCHCSCSMDV